MVALGLKVGKKDANPNPNPNPNPHPNPDPNPNKVGKKDADALFDTFDPDGGGSIDYKELQKALKRRVALDPSLQASAVGAVKIELSSKNKVQRAGSKVVAANRVRGERGAALNSNVQVDPDSDEPIQEQLRQIL
eukprot:scaffold48001_cov48-Phaeocystis_antarctica.AAC.2